MLRFYFVMFIVYLVAATAWFYLMHRYREQQILIHKFIAVVLTFGLIECALMYFEYYIFNKHGVRSFFYVLQNVIISALAKTFARVIVLLVSLGYGILLPSVSKYHPQIAMLSFIYLISNGIYMTVLYMNHTQPISKALSLVVSLPLSVTNTIFFYWILAALRRTLN